MTPVAVDELHDRCRGLVLAETELAADEHLLDIIEVVGVPLVRDVTHDDRFSGGALATAGRAPLFFAGDAFAGGRIEGAAVSGIETARAIIERANKKSG